jgi:hypothetical protein
MNVSMCSSEVLCLMLFVLPQVHSHVIRVVNGVPESDIFMVKCL